MNTVVSSARWGELPANGSQAGECECEPHHLTTAHGLEVVEALLERGVPGLEVCPHGL